MIELILYLLDHLMEHEIRIANDDSNWFLSSSVCVANGIPNSRDNGQFICFSIGEIEEDRVGVKLKCLLGNKELGNLVIIFQLSHISLNIIPLVGIILTSLA